MLPAVSCSVGARGRGRAPMALPLARPWRLGPLCTSISAHIGATSESAAAGVCIFPGLLAIGPTTGGSGQFKVQLALCMRGQRPRASRRRSKLNILFDHALGLFKILDHTEPNSHALPPHHCTAPARTPPCTTLALHHLDSFCTTLALHHTTPHSPAPHSPCTTRTTLACTTFALHHTLDVVLHHAIHHSSPAPHCTTLACTTSTGTLHHICPAPQVTS